MELLGRGGELLGERGDFIRLALHRRDRRADFAQHGIEALLEETELVGLRGGGTHREEPLLRFAHHDPRAADTLDQRRGDALERHGHRDEDAGLEVRGRVEAGSARIELPVQPARAEVGERGDEDEEVADRLTLIERVRQHRDEQRRDDSAMAVPHDEHVDQRDVEQREHVDEPPAVPPALVDHPHERVDHRARAGDQDDRSESGADHSSEPAERAQQEERAGDGPAAAVAPLERLEVLEALLDCGGIVVPAANARAKGWTRGGHCTIGWEMRPRSVAVRNASTRYPALSSVSRPPSCRSTTAITPSTWPPSPSTALMASRAEAPVVSTSSTTTTAIPDSKHPSIRLPVPWLFGCLRTVKASRGRPRRRAVSANA